jgi:O-acetylhomoserine/O-acetylserine sulfhydrylase-like pyridoxal-dependent enzyme
MIPMTPHIETIAVHAGMEGVTESGSHVPVIDLSTTNPLAGVESGGDSYENLATGGTINDGDSAVYQRLWQPGVARFETALSALEGTAGTVAFASGMAALAAVLIASVTAGKPHMVALRPIYGGTDHVLATGLLGTTVTWVDAAGVAGGDPPRHRPGHPRVPGEPDPRARRHSGHRGCRRQRAGAR